MMPDPRTKSDRNYGFRLAPGGPGGERWMPEPGNMAHGLLTGIVMFFREFAQTAFTSYHPERHYMRGPGPACASKQKRQEA